MAAPVVVDWDALPILQIVYEGDDLWSEPYVVDSIVFNHADHKASFLWEFGVQPRPLRLEKVRLVWGPVFNEQDYDAHVPTGGTLTINWEIRFE